MVAMLLEVPALSPPGVTTHCVPGQHRWQLKSSEAAAAAATAQSAKPLNTSSYLKVSAVGSPQDATREPPPCSQQCCRADRCLNGPVQVEGVVNLASLIPMTQTVHHCSPCSVVCVLVVHLYQPTRLLQLPAWAAAVHGVAP